MRKCEQIKIFQKVRIFRFSLIASLCVKIKLMSRKLSQKNVRVKIDKNST